MGELPELFPSEGLRLTVGPSSGEGRLIVQLLGGFSRQDLSLVSAPGIGVGIQLPPLQGRPLIRCICPS